MRILHLFANYKWTGPADPAIRTARRLRGLGADVTFAEAQWTLPEAEHRVRIELDRTDLPRLTELELRKHFRLGSVLRDVRRLTALLNAGRFDLLHTHLPADHLIAALARRRARRRVLLVRTIHDPQAPRRRWRAARSFAATDGAVVPTDACGAELRARFRIAPERVLVQDPPVEPRAAESDGWRQRRGLPADAVLIGITARIQPHRRFDLLWQVARRVADVEPRARFVLLGRGNPTDTQALVTEPIGRLRLRDHVLLPGYLYEPEYGQALASLDLSLFLVPGSDGTCRAVREVMALGVPVVATRRGILPELLAEGGVVTDEAAEPLAAALLALIRDPGLARRLGGAGRERVRTRMDPAAAAERLFRFYQQLGELPS